MTASRQALLTILRENLGFEDPEEWVDYAARHSFTRISATPNPSCPDCGCSPRTQLGQYVYYSTLMHLMVCRSCQLIWADAHLDQNIVSAHFEKAYKDRDYFLVARSWIFRHLATEVAQVTPHGGSVLDVGGGQGDLMQMLKRKRPDITAVVLDLSQKAVKFAEEQFGLPTICGGVDALSGLDARFDVVVLSDVLYYEPRLADLWRALSRLVAPGGALVIRVPNKLLLIRVRQVVSRLAWLGARNPLQDRVKYFNPEHIYILSRSYLTTRLNQLGFAPVQVLPSPPLVSSSSELRLRLGRMFFRGATAISRVSKGRLVVTPSMVLIGKRAAPEGRGKSSGR